MKIGIGSDHGGYKLKEIVVNYLKEKGYEVKDYGIHEKSKADYPDYGYKVAKAVSKGECEKGIVICGTGQGIMMAANKVHGIRCGVAGDVFSAEMIAKHNNANMIALGARVTAEGLALRIVDAYLKSSFEGGRHAGRVEKIMKIENETL